MNNSLATLAPYKSTANFTNNFPNKIIDSLSYGLPVITGLRGEVQSFLAQSQAGIFCEDTSVSWAEAIFSILNDNCLAQKLSSNASEAYAANFTSDVIYGEFIKKLELLAHS